MTVGQVIAKLGVDPKEYEKGLKKAEAQADKAGLKIGNIFKNAFSVTLGMGMFDALKKGFKSTVGTAISFNSMLQTAQIGFATMLGSAEKAQAFLDNMADFAAKTPFEYPELLEAAKKMLAYGFAAENVLPTLRAVGDATAALGMGSEGIDRVTLALGQILAKGKLSGEEMRQLTEAGIPAWHMLAEAMGTTVPALQDMVSKGLVPGGKAVEMLTAGMTKRFGGMMASMEDTWQGVTSSIKDIWRMTVGTLTQNLFGGLNAMLIKVRDFLSQFYSMLNAVMGKKAKQTTDGLVQSTQEQASAMVDVGDATEEAAKKAKKNLQTFDEVHQLQEDMADTAIDLDMGTFSMGGIDAEPTAIEMPEVDTQPMTDKLMRLAEWMTGFWTGLKTTFKSGIEVLKGIWLGDWDKVRIESGSIFTRLFGSDISEKLADMTVTIGKKMGETKGIVIGIFSDIGGLLGEVFGFMQLVATDAFAGISSFFSETLPKIKDTFVTEWDAINLYLSGIWETISITSRTIFDSLKEFWQEHGRSVVDIWTSSWGLILEAVNTVWTVIAGIGRAIFGSLQNFFATHGESVTQTLTNTWETIMNIVRPIWQIIYDTAMVIFNALKDFWQAHGDTVMEFLITTWELIWTVIKFIWDNVLAAAKDIFGRLEKFWQNWGGNITRFFKDSLDFLGNLFAGTLQIISGIFKIFIGIFTGDWEKAWEGIKDIFEGFWSGLVKNAFTWGKNLISNIIDGIKSMVGRVKDTVKDVASTIKGFLGFSSPTKEGPGRDADKWAPNFVDMYRKGISQGIPGIRASVSTIADEMAGLASMTVQPAVRATASVGYMADSGMMSEGIAQAVYRAIIDAFRITQASSGQSGNDDKELVLKIDNTVLARMQLPAIIREGQRQGLNLVVQPQGV